MEELIQEVKAKCHETGLCEAPVEGDFVDMLFRKASKRFLEDRGKERIYEVASRAAATLRSFTSQRSWQDAFIDSWENDSGISILIATENQPFIVSTLVEICRRLQLKILVYLHPILHHGDRIVSLSYMELVGSEASNRELLTSEFRIALAELGRATRSYRSIRELTDVHSQRVRALGSRDLDSNIFGADEVATFLRWLLDDCFIFLGFAVWPKKSSRPREPEEGLGILSADATTRAAVTEELQRDLAMLQRSGDAIWVSRLSYLSPVHRRVRLYHVLVNSTDDRGEPSVISLVGLLTSTALTGESSKFPLIRQKLRLILDEEDAFGDSHEYKHIVDMIDRMPMDEALRVDVSALREMVRLSLGLLNADEVRVSLYLDEAHRGLSCLVILPRERFDPEARESIRQYFENLCNARPGSSEYHVDLSLSPFLRLYIQAPLREGELPAVDNEAVESDIKGLLRKWGDIVKDTFRIEGFSDEVTAKFIGSFPQEYIATNSPITAVEDVKSLLELKNIKDIGVRLCSLKEGDWSDIRIFTKNRDLLLSDTLPVLENAGLLVRNSKASHINTEGKCCYNVYQFWVRPSEGYSISDSAIESILCEGIEGVLEGRYENDLLNALMLRANMSAFEISLLRNYSSYLWQVNRFATRSNVYRVLAASPIAARLLWNLFYASFAPEFSGDRQSERLKYEEEYRDLLRGVNDLTTDRILRGLYSLIEKTVRTNLFVKNQTAIAIKFNAKDLDLLGEPRPAIEVFVRAPDLEGVHLRGSKVARGGIRWSERVGDFRWEVLGLMKTQRAKNVFIVPDGAKGGFIVKRLPLDPGAKRVKIEESYKIYIRALLSITDNLVNGEIEKPKDVICYDEDDSYFVVAADKGTANFSDVANEIAVNEFNFWLGDAFASGGKNGYSHKVYGITARGAWESVIRHFRDLEIPFESEAFRVIGIGDMSGDVFGNGMLLSSNIKLIAAFNHKHIFIDPNPDIEVSFAERKRLFELPVSEWSDYDKSKISDGGGVFLRAQKEIPINQEILRSLAMPDGTPDVIDGERLISLILKAPGDLLWSGGIGTYVKESGETNAEVSDSSNDGVRVNATDLRVRVIGEGGNLGLTQRARIQFSRLGGKVNTDAIDNSGGVDLSDREVNLKILLSGLIGNGTLSEVERNFILEEAAPEIVELVLENNRSQAATLSAAERRSPKNIGFFQSLIRQMIRAEILSRAVDILPQDDEFQQRQLAKQGMYRPELATCLSAVKMWLRSELLSSSLLDDPLLRNRLLAYFPKTIRDRFSPEIEKHPLKRNIIASQVVNEVIDLFGISYVHRMCDGRSYNSAEVVKCCLAAEMLFGGQRIRKELWGLDRGLSSESFISLRQELNRSHRRTAGWFLTYHRGGHLQDLVDSFLGPYDDLLSRVSEFLSPEEFLNFQTRRLHYDELGLSDFAANRLASIPWIREMLQILWAARLSKSEPVEAGRVFRCVSELLGVDLLLRMGDKLEPRDKWEHELVHLSVDEIWRSITLLTAHLIVRKLSKKEEIKASLIKEPVYEETARAILDGLEGGASLPGMTVLARKFSSFVLQACSSSN